MIPATTLKMTQLAATSMTNSATVTANFDCMGADWATIVLSFAVELNTNGVGPTLSLLSSDDTVVTNFATIVADRTAEDLAARKIVRYEVDMRDRKRYLRLAVTTATATNDNITWSAIGILSRLAELPGSTTEMQGSTNDVVVTVT